MPPFWPDKSALWFAQAEAQFELGVMSQKTKFNRLASQLQQHAAEVMSLLHLRSTIPTTG
jgi:hypothetical protein